jgi:hypothetical protein
LRPHLAPTDEEQEGLFSQPKLPSPEIARLGHGHIGWRSIRAAVGADIWTG